MPHRRDASKCDFAEWVQSSRIRPSSAAIPSGRLLMSQLVDSTSPEGAGVVRRPASSARPVSGTHAEVEHSPTRPIDSPHGLGDGQSGGDYLPRAQASNLGLIRCPLGPILGLSGPGRVRNRPKARTADRSLYQWFRRVLAVFRLSCSQIASRRSPVRGQVASDDPYLCPFRCPLGPLLGPLIPADSGMVSRQERQIVRPA